MKRWIIAVSLGIAAVLCMPKVYGEEPFSPVTPQEYAQWQNALPAELREDTDSLPENGELMSILWEKTLSSLRQGWPSAASLMTKLLGILMVCSVLTGCGSGLLTPGVTPAWELCITLCLAVSVTDTVYALAGASERYLERMTSIANGVSPVVCAVAAASGKLSSAAAGRVSMMLLCAVLQNTYVFFLFPTVKMAFCLGIAGNLGSTVRIDALSRLVRRIFLWVLAGLGILLSFLIASQTWIARSADSLTFRTVKFALSSFIPLVGSSLAEALGTAAGGLQMIRQSCGILSAAGVLLYLLPTSAELLLHRLVLSLCQGAAELLGCEREGKLLGEMHGIVGYMTAVVCVSSLLFLFVLILMMGVSGAG